MALGESWLDLLHRQQVDFTLAWRHLADAADGNEAPLRRLFADQAELGHWLLRWRKRRAINATDPASVQAMRTASPWIIPRNQRVEEALIAAADSGDLGPFRKLLHALRHPHEEDPALAVYAEPAARSFMSGFRTFCGT